METLTARDVREGIWHYYDQLDDTASTGRRDGEDEAHKRSTSGTITQLRAILARIARQAAPPHPHPRLAAIHHIVKELEATGNGGFSHAEAQ